jgi:hypothetical protein
MAKEPEPRRDEAGTPLERAKERAGEALERARESIEGAVPEELARVVRDHPLLAIGGAMAAGFLLAVSPITPRTFLRASLGTFAGRFAGERLAILASQAVATGAG